MPIEIKQYDKMMKKLRKAKKQAAGGKPGAADRLHGRQEDLTAYLLKNGRPLNR